MAKREPKSTKAGRRIIAALTELADNLKRGEPIDARYTVHTVTLPDERACMAPPTCAPARRPRRQSGGVARLLGVSAKLVQAWERGDRQPAGPVRRLMDDMVADPAKWKRFLSRPMPCCCRDLPPAKEGGRVKSKQRETQKIRSAP